MECNFTYDHYDKILKLINKKGYVSQFFWEKKYKKNILIRHDIDIDIDKAYKIADIEESNHIKSTYFIWLESPFYNIFDNHNKEIIEKILSKGHEIGIHFDANNNVNKIQDTIELNKKIFKNYFGIEAKVISFHKPSEEVFGDNLKLDNLINTYGNNFFYKYKYISDSRGIWRKDCICKVINSNYYNNIQFLMHPIWWNMNDVNNINSIKKYLEMRKYLISQNLMKNISIYKD